MKNKDYWKILNHLNKKFADNKIKINKIVFYSKIKEKKPEKGVIHGFYRIRDKVIGIKKDISQLDQLETLLHEFTHAYEDQILKSESMRHTKIGGKIFSKFKKESDKILKISV